MTFKKQLPYQPLSVVRLLMFNYFIAYGLWLEKCFRFRKGNVVRQHCVFSIWRLILILYSLTFLLLSVIYFSFQWIYHELKLETRKSLYLVFCSQFFARNWNIKQSCARCTHQSDFLFVLSCNKMSSSSRSIIDYKRVPWHVLIHTQHTKK